VALEEPQEMLVLEAAGREALAQVPGLLEPQTQVEAVVVVVSMEPQEMVETVGRVLLLWRIQLQILHTLEETLLAPMDQKRGSNLIQVEP
jgi:hypothetical protein